MSQFKKALLCLLFMSTGYVYTFAQEVCGFQPSPEQIAHFDRSRSQRQQFNGLRSSTVRWLPIQFHEGIATSGTNATPRIYYDLINSHLAALNQLFAPYNIQFFECAIKKNIANNALFGFDSSEEPLLSPYETPNVINVYFFQSVSNNGNPVCGYSYLPPSADRVFISKGCTEQAIFLHEMGHYLGLYHTHGKTNGLTDELVNGSNCLTAGDEICDTPADPNLNTGVMYGCNYIGTGRDANGAPYQPDPTNLMSYSHVSCKNRFTPQQLNRMAYTVLNDRAYLTGCSQPNACENPISVLPQRFDFETGLENWSNGWFTPEGHLPFVRNSGATPNPNTGPNAAYSGSFYNYLESSQDTSNYYRYGFLKSPCFDLRGYSAPKMSFRYHAFGNSVLELAVGASRNGGATWDSLLFSIPMLASSNTWQEVVCDLSPFIDAPLVQFGILAAIIQGNQGDIAIDDIRFYNDTTVNCNLTLTPTLRAPSCTGGSNGQILVQSTGGSGPINYLWSTGGTTDLINGLNAGTYSVSVTDSLGCTLSATYTLLEPPVLQVNLTATHVSVAGQSSGAISTTVSGGVAPYYYTWSNGATSSGINNLSAGTYTVTVVDSKDCQQVRAVVITEPAAGCGAMYSTFPWSGGFESNFLIFERVMGYQTNWVRRNSATPNANTGPDAAYQGNYYAFINSSHPNRTAVLQTEKCLNLSAVVNPVLKFHYHMFGAQMGSLFVEISTNNGASWTTIWSLSGNQGNQWNQANISLQAYQNNSIRIRFRGVTASNTSDMALDALYIGPAGGSSASLAAAPISIQTKPELSVYPNPSQGLVNFRASHGQAISKLELYNAAGQKIWQGATALPEQAIDLSNQAEGLYIARAWINGQVVVSKFLIQRN